MCVSLPSHCDVYVTCSTWVALSSSVQLAQSSRVSWCCTQLPPSSSLPAVRVCSDGSLWQSNRTALAWPAFSHCSCPFYYRCVKLADWALLALIALTFTNNDRWGAFFVVHHHGSRSWKSTADCEHGSSSSNCIPVIGDEKLSFNVIAETVTQIMPFFV